MINPHQTIFEPCSGNGAITRVLEANGLTRIITNDVDPEITTPPGSCRHYTADAAASWVWQQAGKNEIIDWVITNPPYEAQALVDIMKEAFAYARIGVAMLLRLTANEPVIKRTERGEVLMQHADGMRYLIPFSAPRPTYTDDGKTDSATTAWFIWYQQFSWRRDFGIRSPFQYAVNWIKG
jgi:hypothetical protein